MTNTKHELRKIALILAQDNVKKVQAEKQIVKARKTGNTEQVIWLKKVLAITNGISKNAKRMAQLSSTKPTRKATQ